MLVQLAEQLLEEEVLTYDQVEAVVGPRPFAHENPLKLKEEVPEPAQNRAKTEPAVGGAARDAEGRIAPK